MFCSSFDLCSVHGVRFYFCNTFGTVTSEIWIFGSDYLSNRIINAIQYKVCAFDTKIIGLVILKQNFKNFTRPLLMLALKSLFT